MESKIYWNFLEILERNSQPENQEEELLPTGKYGHLIIHVAHTFNVAYV